MSVLQAMLSGGRRREEDFYPTPPDATEALVRAGLAPAGIDVWEPACGDGAVSRVLERHGYRVVSTDLVDRGFGTGGVDFLNAEALLAPAIVTNPPFSLAAAFIRHAFALGAQELALLLKAQFWHAAGRLPLFQAFPPTVVAPLTWRLDFTGAGAPHTDCSWVVWDRSRSPTIYQPLRKPAKRAPLTLAEMLE